MHLPSPHPDESPGESPGDPSRAPDHRGIAQQMELIAASPLVGAGLPLWLPPGAAIRRELEQFGHELAIDGGCEAVYSPVLAKRELYERSGHWAKFADDMFAPIPPDPDDDHPPAPRDQLVLRPANCPHHAQLYTSSQRSYRDLPIRYHELGAMFRAERSGVVSGLSRVRQINLDDTHVFCRPDQVGSEVRLALAAVSRAADVLGVAVDHVRLSLRDDGPGYLGDDATWAAAEAALRAALAEARGEPGPLSAPLREAPGEAAFYGPKIDVQVRDALGHDETLATVQIDHGQPEGLDLRYVAADGSRPRPVMIHRGVLGSMERLVAFLLELHDGRLPFWLAPVHLCLLPVGADQEPVARAQADRLRATGLRIRVESGRSLGARIRDARRRRDALIGVVGPSEAADQSISVTDPVGAPRVRLDAGLLADRLAAAHAARARHPDLT